MNSLFSDRQQVVLRTVLDTLIPPDDFPGAQEAGGEDYIVRLLQSSPSSALETYRVGLDGLDAEAEAVYGTGFAELEAEQKDTLLRRVERGDTRAPWATEPRAFFQRLVYHAAEGYYSDPGSSGNRNAVGWRLIGFDPDRARMPFLSRRTPNAQRPTPNADYDVVIVGAGAAGGVVAGVLAEAGKRVLLLERGKDQAREEMDGHRDHLRNHRLSIYGHNTGPELEGNPRVFVNRQGEAQTIRPHEGGWNNNAMCVGGGTRVYGAQAWRFLPQDFRMASRYGVPPGSSLADWPIAYDDLAPYYERAEWEVGVCGDSMGNRFQGPRQKAYPMPPVPTNPSRTVLKEGANRLGWNTFPVPLLVNTVAYNGRPACAQCNQCIGFACPVDAKNGSQNTLIPRALATGNCDLVTEAVVERIETDAQGKVTGVSVLLMEEGSPNRVSIRAKTVVVSSGAIESARLLLNSSSPLHPAGLGNEYDQVGRHLQGHYYPGANGLMPDIMNDNLGPGVSLATCEFNHDNPDVIGGGMLANDFIETPIFFWRTAMPSDAPRWGAEGKRWMRDTYRRWVEIKGPVQEIPSPNARVSLDPSVRDKYGLPVVRLSGTTHPETVRTAEYLRTKAIEWLQASGAEKIWSASTGLRLSAGQHQAGTCRMGTDPRTSVTDPWGRVHGHDNLFVIDGSLHVTNGGFNPVLTILALAFRNAEYLAPNA